MNGRTLTIALLALNTACEARPSRQFATQSDSAGVRTVLSSAAARNDTLGENPLWRYDGAPVGAEPINLADATMLVTSGGRTVIANTGGGVIVTLDPAGTELWRFGRIGAGPGEFQGALSLAAVADTLFALDFPTRRLTAVDPGGTLLRVTTITTSAANLSLVGAFADGSLGLTSRFLFGPEQGINRDSASFYALRPRTVEPVLLDGWTPLGNVDFVMGAYGPNIHDQALGPVGSVVVEGERLMHSDGARAEVAVRDARGTLQLLARWGETPQPVTQQDRAAFEAMERSRVSPGLPRSRLEEWLAKATWSERLPLTDGVVALPGAGFLVGARCQDGAARCAFHEFAVDGTWVRTIWIARRVEHAGAFGRTLVTLSRTEDGLAVIEAWPL